ncbi:MAG: radical SAM protein [Dehalococcoidia bacterium]|nr:MAG: radical SAM protein [Dehalococcoidia bacterium]
MEIKLNKLSKTKQDPKDNVPKSTVYGPVDSWRLGRSLGIDLLCGDQKVCCLNCIYCQFGDNPNLQTERQEFVNTTKLSDDLKAIGQVDADWVTFSGMGEPTLATNLGDAIKTVKSLLNLPVVIITNGGLITHEDVRTDLALADMVIAKLDAPDESLFKAINRPSEGINLRNMVQGWLTFRTEYKGKLALSMMLCDMNKRRVHELSLFVKYLMPDQVQLNTPLRPSNIKPLTAGEIENLHNSWFRQGKNVITVHEAKNKEVESPNKNE